MEQDIRWKQDLKISAMPLSVCKRLFISKIQVIFHHLDSDSLLEHINCVGKVFYKKEAEF